MSSYQPTSIKIRIKTINELREFILSRKNNNKYIGKIVKFQVADGYAKYMVASVKPLELVHLPLDDEYEFQYIQNLKWSDIKERIDSEEKLNKLFTITK